MNSAVRISITARLAAAAGLLLGNGHKDSSAAVIEAAQAIQDQSDGDLNDLRVIRQFHFDQFRDLQHRANDLQKKSDGRALSPASRDAFERAANGFRTKANQHLRFVRQLNAFFPASDSIIH